MTDLRNVWLCSPWAMLIRADHIVALRGKKDNGELATATDLQAHAGTDAPPRIWLTVEVTGAGNGERATQQVTLFPLDPRGVAAVISDLPAALARASESTEAPLYVYFQPGAPGEPLWQVTGSPPPHWPG